MISLAKQYGPNLGGRGIGARVRADIQGFLTNEAVTIDFSGVQLLSHSFADEVFGKLAEQHGVAIFKSRVLVRNISDFDKAILSSVVRDRAQEFAS